MTGVTEAWAEAVDSLNKVLNRQAIADWIEPLKVISEEGERLVVRAPSHFHRDWVKDHYLQFLLDRLRERTNQNFEILYVSCETFMNHFIASLKSPDRQEEFRRRYREEPDVLLVDDIQFLSGKNSTQEEFFNSFNALHGSQKQIVLSSDRPPEAIDQIPDRLRSRFKWGLVVEIAPPDLETRIAILKRKAELAELDLPDEVAQLLAQAFKRNVRELESALIRLSFFASMDGNRRITRELAETKLPELTARANDRVTIDQVLRHVAEHYGCKVTDLKSPKRHSQITKPRAVAMYLCAKLTGCSLPEIGRGFGGKHHTTVLAARDKITRQIETDRALKNEIEAVSQKITN